MKIFSLQSKKALVLWSIVFGIIIDQILFKTVQLCQPRTESCMDGSGIPIMYYHSIASDDYAPMHFKLWLLNILFWVLVVFVILLLLRYLKRNIIKSGNIFSVLGILLVAGCISGIVSLALVLLVIKINHSFNALFIPIPGLVYGITMAFFLPNKAKDKIILRSIAAVIVMMLGYYLAVIVFNRAGDALSPNGPVYKTATYLLSMAFAGAVGSLLVAVPVIILGVKLSIKNFIIVILGGTIAAMLIPGQRQEWIGILPNLYILYPLWQGVVGGVLGYISVEKFQNKQIKAPNLSVT